MFPRVKIITIYRTIFIECDRASKAYLFALNFINSNTY